MSVFHFVILTLAAFRIQRIFTADSWYFTQGFRRYLHRKALPYHKASKQNLWTELSELFHCPWCFGWWTTLAVFLVDHLVKPHIYIWAAIAASGLVGLIGSRLDDDAD